MKKIIFMACMLSTHVLYAQNKLESTGNVGIGTNNPQSPLEVVGTTVVKGPIVSAMPEDIGGTLALNNPSKTGNGAASSWQIFNMTGSYGNSLQFWAYDNVGCVEGGLCAPRFTLRDNGNVGIGINSPQYKLQVHGDYHADISIGAGANANTGNLVFYEQTPSMAKVELSYWGQATNGYNLTNKFAFIGHNQNNTPYTGFEFGKFSETVGYLSLMTLNTNDEKVGIGTINPKEKLSVNGTILAKKVRVSQSASDWPDYVFNKSYPLASLDSVEAFINDNKHLPGIPSATTVEKEGHDLGEMQKAMLQKIEELTLYVIELKKENAEIKKQLKKQKK